MLLGADNGYCNASNTHSQNITSISTYLHKPSLGHRLKSCGDIHQLNREPNSHASATAYIGYKIPGTLEPCTVGLPRQKPRHKWNLALPTVRHGEAFQIGRHTAHYHKIKRLETARESLPQPTVLKVEILADINLVPFSGLSPNKTGNVFILHVQSLAIFLPLLLSATVKVFCRAVTVQPCKPFRLTLLYKK